MNNTAIHDKVAASTLGVAVSQVLIWIVETAAKIDMPFAVEGAIAVILTFGSGYFVKERKPPTA